MSRAERFALTGALALLLLQALVTAIPSAGPALEYQRAALASEPWRIVTGHLVHINWLHGLINAVAWFIVARLFAGELRVLGQVMVMALASGAISAGLAWSYPEIAWYRGFSGVLHALFFAGASAWLARTLAQTAHRTLAGLVLPAALWFGGWGKVLLEQPGGAMTPVAAWLGAPTVPQAHLIGALCGTLCGLGLAWARARESAAPTGLRDERE
jgi:rhomboid family GlyGly-CTERM serine protease